MTSPTESAASPRLRALLLGLFLLFPDIYLPLANVIHLVRRERPAPKAELDEPPQAEGLVNAPPWLRNSLEGVSTALERWSEFSGQEQTWSLFADFGTQSI